MEVDRAGRRKEARTELLALFKRLVTSWEFWVALAVAATGDFWLWPAVYFFLYTYLITPSGLIAWTVIFASTFLGIACFAAPLVLAARASKPIRAARLRLKNGIPGAEDELEAARRPIRNLNFGRMILVYAFAHIAIPAYVATALWSDIKAPPITSLKHPVITTPQQRLEHSLAYLRKQGIYRKFERSE